MKWSLWRTNESLLGAEFGPICPRDDIVSIFTVSVNATDFYNGLDAGNSDLSTPQVSATDFVGVQPGVGDSINRYNGLDDGNSDLFKADNSGLTDSGDAPDIYMGIAGNPDLQF